MSLLLCKIIPGCLNKHLHVLALFKIILTSNNKYLLKWFLNNCASNDWSNFFTPVESKITDEASFRTLLQNNVNEEEREKFENFEICEKNGLDPLGIRYGLWALAVSEGKTPYQT